LEPPGLASEVERGDSGRERHYLLATIGLRPVLEVETQRALPMKVNIVLTTIAVAFAAATPVSAKKKAWRRLSNGDSCWQIA
jgi:hypothetical protein